jgi:hypothetical protein
VLLATAVLASWACGGAGPTQLDAGRVEASFEVVDDRAVTCENYPGYMFTATVRNGTGRNVRIGSVRVLHRDATILAAEGRGEGTECENRDLTWQAPAERIYAGGSLTFRWGAVSARWRAPYTGRLACSATNQLQFEVLDAGNGNFVGSFESPAWPLRMDVTPACGERL